MLRCSWQRIMGPTTISLVVFRHSMNFDGHMPKHGPDLPSKLLHFHDWMKLIFSLRKEWAIRSAHSSTEQSIMGLDGQSQSLLNALQSMTANPPNYMAGMNQNRPSPVARSLNRSQTDSSLSNSPYNSSPSLISPVYDPTIGPPLPFGRQASPHPQQQYMVQSSQQPGSGEYWTTTSSMPPPSNVGPSDYNRQQSYDVQSFPSQSLHQQLPPYQTQDQTMGYQQTQGMGYIPQQQQGQGQEQTPTGRYVFQPDGSQIYIPYNQE